MKTTNVFKIGLLVMIIANVVLVLQLTRKPHRKAPPRNGESPLMMTISKQLMLSSEQEKSYFRLVEAHREEVRKVDRKQRQKIRAYFSFLKDSQPDTDKKSAALNQLKELEAQKITLTYSHFEDLRKLCDAGQQAQFENILDDLIKVLANENRKAPPPRGF